MESTSTLYSPISVDKKINVEITSVGHTNFVVKVELCGWVQNSTGGGLFIGNLNDVHGLLWKLNPYIREVYKDRLVYTY